MGFGQGFAAMLQQHQQRIHCPRTQGNNLAICVEQLPLPDVQSELGKSIFNHYSIHSHSGLVLTYYCLVLRKSLEKQSFPESIQSFSELLMSIKARFTLVLYARAHIFTGT